MKLSLRKGQCDFCSFRRVLNEEKDRKQKMSVVPNNKTFYHLQSSLVNKLDSLNFFFKKYK